MFRRQRASQPEAAFNASTVDLVATTPDESTVELYIVQTGTWNGSDDQLRSLQEKVHSYVVYAVDGQLVRDFPDLEGRPWRIVLDCQKGEPDPRTSQMLAALVEPLKRYGGELLIANPRP